tara:strand:- start:1145 stop:1360 length:216 start_codon:yes stop_codon:yes gene_type:complete
MDYSKRKKLHTSLKEAGRLDLFYNCVFYDPGLDGDGDPVKLVVEDLKNILIKLNPEKKIYKYNKEYDFIED